MREGMLSVGAVVIAAGMLLGMVGEASAQPRMERVFVTASNGPTPGGGMIARRSVEKYAGLLGFSEEQRESALLIHDAYAASYRDVLRARSDALAAVRRSAEDSGDNSVFVEKLPEISREYTEKLRKLEKGFFDDLRALCDGSEQESRWVRVERMRRRETELRYAGISGAGVDLIAVVDGLKLPSDAADGVKPTLEEYEIELDTHLRARQQLQGNEPAFKPGEPPDIEALRRSMEEAREAGLKLKAVNERFTRRVEAALPESHQTAFRDAVRHATYPQVYRRSPILRDIEKALTLPDLSPEQRATLTELKESYERDVKPLNDAWAAAISKAEERQSGGVALGGMVVQMNDEPEELREARRARRLLDDSAREKIQRTLSDAQQAAIKPKPGEGTDGEVFEMVQDAVLVPAAR
jgi:hypothetical protein